MSSARNSLCPSEEERLQAEMYETLRNAYAKDREHEALKEIIEKSMEVPKMPKFDLKRKKFSNFEVTIPLPENDAFRLKRNTALGTHNENIVKIEMPQNSA